MSEEEDRDELIEATISAILALSIRLGVVDGSVATNISSIAFHRSLGLSKEAFIRIVSTSWDKITDEQVVMHVNEADEYLRNPSGRPPDDQSN